MADSLMFGFQSLSLHVIEISIGQFLLPFERLRIKRLSKYYETLFPAKTTILSMNAITHHSAPYISNINVSTFWNLLNYLQKHIMQKYFVETQQKISCTHEMFDELPANDYFMLKYLLIYYDELRTHACALTALAFENGAEIKWNKVFNMLPVVNELCFAFNTNHNQSLTIFMNDIFAFCSNIKSASYMKTLSFCRAGIDDHCIKQWCKTMMERDVNDGYFAIQSLDFSFNKDVSDQCMTQLFDCIAYKCPKLEVINLSSTNISDETCKIIYDFYHNYYGKDTFELCLYSINIMRCDKITKHGRDILSAICMRDWRPDNFYIYHSLHENDSQQHRIGVNV